MGLIWMFMLIAGLWALLAGKLPMVLFGRLGTHKVDGTAAKTIGASLAFAAFLSYFSIVVLNIFSTSANPAYNLVCSAVPTVLFLGGAAISVRRLEIPYQISRVSGDPLSPEATEIQKQVVMRVRRSTSLIAIGLGVAIIVFPLIGAFVFALAFIQAGRAISPMEAAHAEDRYSNDVNFLRLLSSVLFVSSLVLNYVVF